MAIIIGDDRPRRVYVVGATAQSTFTAPWPFFAAADIKVTITAGGVDTSLGLGAGYTVSGAGGQSGTVTLAAPVTNCSVTVYRDMAIERTTSFPVAGTLKMEALNREFDRATMIEQQLRDDVGRAIKLPVTDDVTDLTLPSSAARAGRLLGFDGAGNLTVTTSQQQVDLMLDAITTARNEAEAARGGAVTAAFQAKQSADLAVWARTDAEIYAANAADSAQTASTAAAGLVDQLKGPPTATLSAFWSSGNRDLGDLGDTSPFLNERWSTNRIDLARGTGFTRDLGSIT